MDKTRTYASHPAAFIDQPVATPHQPRFAQQLFDFGMIATGNQNFERFAALCNTPGGSQELKNNQLYHSMGHCVASASGRQVADPYNGCAAPLAHAVHRRMPLFPIHSYFLPTPTQVGAAGRVREPTYRYKIPSAIKNKHSVNYERGQLKSPEKEI